MLSAHIKHAQSHIYISLSTVKKPKVGMRLDVRDSDYIWSPARVLKLARDKNMQTLVDIHYDGWGEEYDEHSIPWNSDRLAPRFAFTKRVKCLVDILPRQKGTPRLSEMEALPKGAKRTYSNLWPCIVQIRMPHPIVEGLEDVENNCRYAVDFLEKETNILVQPYAPELLSNLVFDATAHDGGMWLNAKRVRKWTNEPALLGVLPKKFSEAFEIAKNDSGTVGVMPMSAFEKRSLLKPIYRVLSREGADLRDGALYAADEIPERYQNETLQPIMVDPSELGQAMAPPEEEERGMSEAQVETNEEAEANQPFVPAPPPTLPPAVPITESLYEDCGVRRCQLTNQWTASVCLGANELFLGKFPTQLQAYQATRSAVGEDVEFETDVAKANLADLQAVPVEAVIEAREKHYDPYVHEFSIHEYALQQIRHEAGLIRLMESQTQEGNGVPEAPVEPVEVPRPTKKRKGTPRKVDLIKHCYID